jgi:hypothetical protein
MSLAAEGFEKFSGHARAPEGATRKAEIIAARVARRGTKVRGIE